MNEALRAATKLIPAAAKGVKEVAKNGAFHDARFAF
jgi:hypothetical protein